MSTIYINRRNVTATKRNGRQNENDTTIQSSLTQNSSQYKFENGIELSGSTVSLSGEYSGYTNNLGQWKITGATEVITTSATGNTISYDVTGFSGNTVEIKGDVFIDGNLKVSKDVVAYFTTEITSDIFNLLSVSQPLFKDGTNISLLFNSSQFEVNEFGELGLLTDLLTGLTQTLTWENITNKPSAFPPSVHTHVSTDITDLHQHTNKTIIDSLTQTNLDDWNEAHAKTTPISISGNTMTISKNLNIEGDISATGDVAAYITSSVSSSVFDALSVSSPLQKSGTNISLNTNNFVMNSSDYYGSTSAITQIITLSSAEYSAIGSKSNNVMYIII